MGAVHEDVVSIFKGVHIGIQYVSCHSCVTDHMIPSNANMNEKRETR